MEELAILRAIYLLGSGTNGGQHMDYYSYWFSIVALVYFLLFSRRFVAALFDHGFQ